MKDKTGEKTISILTTKLNENGMNFRWLVPKGILINWNSRRYRLDSIHKAGESFMTDMQMYGKKNRKDRNKKEKKSREQHKEMLEGVTLSSKGEEEKGDALQKLTEEQREKRSTRKINPIYK